MIDVLALFERGSRQPSRAQNGKLLFAWWDEAVLPQFYAGLNVRSARPGCLNEIAENSGTSEVSSADMREGLFDQSFCLIGKFL